MKVNRAQRVKVADIRTDGGTQSRDSLNQDVVGEYAQAIRDGVLLPLMQVFDDGLDLWLADGFHRLRALQSEGAQNVVVDLCEGSRRDAILHSVGANFDHGLRRTNADKRRAVEMLLGDDEWAQWSDRKIADQCRVSPAFVSGIRRSLKTVFSENEPGRKTRKRVDKHGKESDMDVSGISESNRQRQTDKPPAAPTKEQRAIARLRAIEVDLRAENEQLKEELARLDQITGSDDPMAAALNAAKEADRKRVETERIMQARINGLLEEKAAVIRQVRDLKKRMGER